MVNVTTRALYSYCCLQVYGEKTDNKDLICYPHMPIGMLGIYLGILNEVRIFELRKNI